MKRLGILLFNVGVSLAGATAYAFAVRFSGFTMQALGRAFLDAWWAGLLVGGSVGVGAVLGPRPPLELRKCVTTLLWVGLTTALGGFIAYLFPREWSAADRAMEQALAQRGIFLGSWIGLVVGTVIQIFQVYFTRRRKPGPPKKTAPTPK